MLQANFIRLSTHLNFHLFGSESDSAHPVVFLQDFEGGSSVGLGTDEAVDQSLEALAEEAGVSSLFMQLPKLEVVLLPNEAIDPVVGLGAHERRSALVHDEKNDSQGKHICFEALVVPRLHLGRAVSFSSHSRGQLSVSEIALAVPR